MMANGAFRPISLGHDAPPAPSGWKWRRLAPDLARLESGHTPSRRHPEWWGGDVPWIALPDIRDLDGKTAEDTAEKTNELGLENSAARLLPAGTVVLSRTASVGFVTVMGRLMATSQDFVNWVCGEELEPWFLAHALIASRDYLRELASGAIHKTIYVPTVEQFHICVPPSREKQCRIVRTLDEQMTAVARARAALERQRQALDALPPALLRAAFSGAL
jgi:type I restriction enzyme S subunit